MEGAYLVFAMHVDEKRHGLFRQFVLYSEVLHCIQRYTYARFIFGGASEASEISKCTLKSFVHLSGNFCENGCLECRSVFLSIKDLFVINGKLSTSWNNSEKKLWWVSFS